MLHNGPYSDALNATRIAASFASHTLLWHTELPQAPVQDLPLQLHAANFILWHLEDSARDPAASNATIATVKRDIDTTNQKRNDLVEQLDAALLQQLAAAALPAPTAPLHSETPGMIVDRLSILALKLFHTEEQITRIDASEAHKQRNQDRLAILQTQSNDLAACLDLLWQQVCSGHRQFKLYRQLKMYNDPSLNPVLYAQSPPRS